MEESIENFAEDLIEYFVGDSFGDSFEYPTESSMKTLLKDSTGDPIKDSTEHLSNNSF